MILITVLLCLAIQRIFNLAGAIPDSWVLGYLRISHKIAGKINAILAVCLFVMPVVLFMGIIKFITAKFLYGFFGLLLTTVILFFCIDVRDLVYTKKNVALSNKGILSQAFVAVFPGLFWFMLFGSFGVIIYTSIKLINKNILHIDTRFTNISKLVINIQAAMDWVPSRILAISYALVGNFNKGFGYFKKHAWHGLHDAQSFATASGLAALDLESHEDNKQEQYHVALDLVNRVLIIWLVALFFVTLGFII